jgi:hypothetical protein
MLGKQIALRSECERCVEQLAFLSLRDRAVKYQQSVHQYKRSRERERDREIDRERLGWHVEAMIILTDPPMRMMPNLLANSDSIELVVPGISSAYAGK